MIHFVVVVHGEHSPGLHRESLQSIVGIILVERVVDLILGGFGSLGHPLGLRVGDGDCGDLDAIITRRAGGRCRCCGGDGRAHEEEGTDGATRRTNHC